MDFPHLNHLGDVNSLHSLDDAEKGRYSSTENLVPTLQSPAHSVYLQPEKDTGSSTRMSPLQSVHEGITPNPSQPELSLAFPPGRRPSVAAELKTVVHVPKPMKPKVSRWVLFELWFNTYRKFFVLVTLLNLAGIIMTALGRFPYAQNHLGALVLGNLLMAVMMRNELWFRFLYLVLIYGLRSVCARSHASVDFTDEVHDSGRRFA